MAAVCRKGKDHSGPDCILKMWVYSHTQCPYTLGFDLVRFILPTTSSTGIASLRVSQGKIIHWETSKCPQGKSSEILVKCFVLICIGKVPIIKLISCNLV